MTPTPAATATARHDLPALPLDAWEPTKTTLHMWAQIVGKVKLAATAPRNHARRPACGGTRALVG